MKYNNIPVLYMLLFTNFIMISKLVLVIIDFCETAKLFGAQLTGRMIFDFLVTLAFVIIIIIIVNCYIFDKTLNDKNKNKNK